MEIRAGSTVGGALKKKRGLPLLIPRHEPNDLAVEPYHVALLGAAHAVRPMGVAILVGVVAAGLVLLHFRFPFLIF